MSDDYSLLCRRQAEETSPLATVFEVVRTHVIGSALVQTHYMTIRNRGPTAAYGDHVADGVESWWREAAIVAATVSVVLLGAVLRIDDTPAPPPPAACLLAVVASLALLARHRAPLATLAATTVCGLLVAPLGLLLTPLTIAPAIVSAYWVGAQTGVATARTVLPAAAALVVPPPFVDPVVSWEDASRFVTVGVSLLLAAALGRAARHRRANLAFVEERARRAEEDRDRQARQQVAEERLRIARELHDLVAHQITLANAQAGVAVHLFDTRPKEARESLDALVSTTRQALDDLRSTVGLLRQPEDDATPVEPAPGLAQLSTLLDSFRRADLDVAFQHEGTARDLSAALELTAYRVIQEALTNVTKHTDRTDAHVQLTWGTDVLTVTITDDGGEPGMPRRSPGHGLIGLRERAAAAGGTLNAGPRPHGGFRVSLELPFRAFTAEKSNDVTAPRKAR